MMMKCLLDTNVALDIILERQPFVLDAVHVFSLAEAGRIELFISTDAISTIFYVVAKNKNKQAGRQAIAMLLDFVSLAPLSEDVVLKGLAFDFEDIEDALVASVASAIGAQVIITRNGSDFKGSPVPALSPKEFLASGVY